MMTMAIASIAFVVLGFNTDTMASARISPGMAWIASISRWTRRSSRPSQYPHRRPMTIPTPVPMPTASTPTQREIRLPWTTRLRTSRPMSSVPKGWSRLGGASRISGWVASGSYGASTPAKIAVVTSRTRSTADASPSGFRLMTAQSASPRLGVAVGWRSKGATRAVTVDTEDSPSLIMDPRIQPRVRQVDEQVQRQERPELPPDDRDDRDEGVLQRVLVHDDPPLQALGPGRADIVLPQHLEDGRARHAHGGRREAKPEHRCRQQELL